MNLCFVTKMSASLWELNTTTSSTWRRQEGTSFLLEQYYCYSFISLFSWWKFISRIPSCMKMDSGRWSLLVEFRYPESRSEVFLLSSYDKNGVIYIVKLTIWIHIHSWLGAQHKVMSCKTCKELHWFSVLRLVSEFQGLRPPIPKHTNPMLVELMESCWQHDASLRPEFSDIVNMLRQMTRRVRDKI